jgi:hypothetical protein
MPQTLTVIVEDDDVPDVRVTHRLSRFGQGRISREGNGVHGHDILDLVLHDRILPSSSLPVATQVATHRNLGVETEGIALRLERGGYEPRLSVSVPSSSVRSTLVAAVLDRVVATSLRWPLTSRLISLPFCSKRLADRSQ